MSKIRSGKISKKPIRIAVIGVGLIGQRHVETISRSEIAEVACVVDPHPQSAEFASQHEIVSYGSITQMLDGERPDGVIIATPNQAHVENGLECIRANLPILVEKPIAGDVCSARRLVDEADKAGVPILVGHHRRHNPIIQAAKERIESGALGNIVAAHGMCWLYKPDDYFDVTWRTRPGAGPIFINLIHDIDLFRYLLGEVESVQAIQSDTIRGHEIEDTAAIVLQFANGVLATISVSDTIVSPWSWELTAEENPAYPATRQNCYLIGGTRGSLEIPSGKIWSQSEQPSWWKPIEHEAYTVDLKDPLDVQIAHFCDVISCGVSPIVSGLEGLCSLQVIEAVKESANLEKPVYLSGNV